MLKKILDNASRKFVVPMTPEREAAHAQHSKPDSHIHLFNKPEPDMSPAAVEARNQRQRMRLRRAVGSKLLAVLNGPREQFQGPDVMKISFEVWTRMKNDPEFVPFSRYAESLYGVRNAGVNEVGMYKGRVVVIKDAGPGDKGEGAYYQVGVDLKGNKLCLFLSSTIEVTG